MWPQFIYQFTPNSSFFIVCFRVAALKFPCALQGPFDVLHHSALEAPAHPPLLSRNMLASRKGCVLQDCTEQPLLSPFPNVIIQGFPVPTPEENPCIFLRISVDVKPGRPEAELDSHLQPSPAHQAGQHSLQGRGATLKQKC